MINTSQKGFTRLGFLIPPGNPVTETELIQMKRPEFSIHFTRMVAFGETGSLVGEDERNQSQIDHLEENIALMQLVKPQVLALAHTATSYTLGKEGEIALLDRLQKQFQIPLITAFGSVVRALNHMKVKKVAIGTPYNLENTLRCKNLLESHGFTVVHAGNLAGVKNIYDETPERALQLMEQVRNSDAQAIFISGVGMPTVTVIEEAEKKLALPVISSISATLWNALQTAEMNLPVSGFGSLLAGNFRG
jgi:maleate cis-trans isomerase